MHSEFLKSFTKIGFGANYQPTLSDGRFSLLNTAVAKVHTLETDYTSQLELSSEFQCVGFKPTIIKVGPKSDFTGINKKYIDDRGMYDLAMAVDEFSKRVPGTRLTKLEVDALARASPVNDSHEMFIYNMLVTWFKALLYKNQKRDDMKIIIHQAVYKDSHVGMGFRGQYADIAHEISLGLPVHEDVLDFAITVRDASHYWDRPYVIRYDNSDPLAAAYYIIHAHGRDGSSALNVDVPLPGIDFKNVAFEPLGGTTVVPGDYEDIPWGTPEKQWLWIKSYVEVNRLETAFASAFEALSGIAFQPLPSYQESNTWQDASIRLTLAEFTPTRARIPSNLDGEAYIEGVTAHDFVTTEMMAPQNYLVTAAVMNYMVWMSLYAVVADYSTTLQDWRLAYTAHDDNMAVLSTNHARAALVSMLVDKEVITALSFNCNISYDLGSMAKIDRLSFDEVFEEGYPTGVDINGIYPFVSGALLLGAVTAEASQLAHLHGVQHVQNDDYGTYSVEDAIKLANIYRLFGHELEVTHDKSGELYELFSNVRECVVCPTTILTNTRPYDRLLADRSRQRPGRSHTLPDATVYRPKNTVVMTVTAPAISVMEWQSKRQIVRPTVNLQPKRAVLRFKVAASTVISHATFGTRYMPGGTAQGFHRAQPGLAPVIPLARVPVAPTLIIPEAELEEEIAGDAA